MLFFLTLTIFVALSEGILLPPNFKKCNRHKDDMKSCLLEAAQAGVRQLNRPYKQLKMISLDPLEIPRIEASVETQLINISSVLKDCKFWGLVDAQITTFDIDFDHKTIKLEGIWPHVRSQCWFSMSGQILRSTIEGQGPSSADFRNFKFSFGLNYEEVRRKGKTYVKATSSSLDGKPDLVTMSILPEIGDKEVTERLNKVLNDNWSELYDDVKSYYLENARQTWLQIMNGWFQRLSLEEAFDS